MSPITVQTERIVIETDRYRVEADIKLLRGNYQNSLIEYLNHREEEFLFLTNVDLVALDGSGRDWSTPVLFLAKRHIRSVVMKKNPGTE